MLQPIKNAFDSIFYFSIVFFDNILISKNLSHFGCHCHQEACRLRLTQLLVDFSFLTIRIYIVHKCKNGIWHVSIFDLSHIVILIYYFQSALDIFVHRVHHLLSFSLLLKKSINCCLQITNVFLLYFSVINELLILSLDVCRHSLYHALIV